MSRFFSFLLLVLASAAGAPPDSGSETLRIAVQDFHVEGESYWEGRRAASFTTAVQTMAVAPGGVEWVERAELDRAIREIGLSLWSGGDTRGNLALGHWLAADALVRGKIRFAEDGRKLRLEAIDLKRADVVASDTVALSSSATATDFMGADIAVVATALNAVVEDAVDTLQATPSQRVVAPLFFRNTDTAQRLDFLEERLLAALQKEGASSDDARVLRLSRPGEALAEKRLALSGLVGRNEEVWRNLADVYLWGEYEEIDSAGRSFEETLVEIRVTLWGGAGEAVTARFQGVAGEVDELVGKAAGDLLGKAHGLSIDDESSSRPVAEHLLERAGEVRAQLEAISPGGRPGRLETAQGRTLRQYRLNLLETAHFFQPGDVKIFAAQMSALHHVPAQSDFRSNWNYAETVFDFAAGQENYPMESGEIFEHVRRAFQALGEALSGTPGGRRGGLPLDIPSDIHREWREQLETRYLDEARRLYQSQQASEQELPRRLANAAPHILQAALDGFDDEKRKVAIAEIMWPVVSTAIAQRGAAHNYANRRLRESLLLAFRDAGKLERGLELLDAGKGAESGSARSESAAAGISANRGGRAPARGDRNPAFAVGPADAGPRPLTEVFPDTSLPEAEPPPFDMDLLPLDLPYSTHPIRFTQGRSQVFDHPKVMEWAGGRLWIGADRVENRSQRQIVPHRSGGIHSNARGPALLTYSPLTGTTAVIEEAGELSSQVSSFLAHGERLWVSLRTDGVRSKDLVTGRWQSFSGEDGVLTARIHQSVRLGEDLLFAGGDGDAPLLSLYEPATGRWTRLPIPEEARIGENTSMAGYGDWLLAGSSPPLLFNRQTGEWADIADRLGKAVPESEDVQVHKVISSENGFWLFTDAGIIHLDPQELDKPERVHPFGYRPDAVAADGNHLWIAVSDPPRQPERPRNLHPRHRRPGRTLPSSQQPRPGSPADHYVLLLDTEADGPMKYLPAPAPVLALAAGPDSVWAGLGDAWQTLLEIEKPGASIPGRKAILPRRPAEDEAAPISLIAAARLGDVDALEEHLADGADLPGLEPESKAKALMAAIRGGSAGAVRLLIESNADVSGQLPILSRFTPMHIAAEWDRPEIFGLLIDAGAPVDALTPEEWTPLMTASQSGYHGSVRFLLEYGANPNRSDRRGNTPLHLAIEQRNGRILQALLDAGGEIDRQDREGRTLLATAAAHWPEAVPFLLARGANPDIPSGNFANAVVAAASSRNWDLVEQLLDSGAAINTGNPRENVLALATTQSKFEIAIDLLDRGFLPARTVDGREMGARSLIQAAIADEGELLERLIAAGVSPNSADSTSQHALSRAAGRNSREAVKLLLQAGANPYATDRNGRTAAYHARAYPEILTLLPDDLDDGSDSEAGRSAGKILLLEGIQQRDSAMVRAALSRGADPDTENEAGWPVLVLAAASGETAIVEALLDAGADIEARGPHTITALMQAAGRNHPRTTALLLDRGADASRRNRSSKTARDLAQDREHLQVLEVFKKLETPSARLVDAIRRQAISEVHQLLHNNVDPNEPAPDGTLPLIAIVTHDRLYRPELHLRHLLAGGLDVNVSDDDGNSALYLALRSRQKSVPLIRLLIENGADVNAISANQISILQAAYAMGPDREQVLPLLNERGARLYPNREPAQ